MESGGEERVGVGRGGDGGEKGSRGVRYRMVNLDRRAGVREEGEE